MKNTKLLCSLLLLSCITLCSQIDSKKVKSQISVEKNIFGIQTGLFGAWIYNETKITNQLALRSELGMDLSLFGGTFYPKTGVIFYPTVTAEPRFYYNLNRRNKLGKKTEYNSGNFFSLKTTYGSDVFAISNYDVVINNHIRVIPKYGLRRSFGKNFEMEFSAGIGYAYDFDRKLSDAILDLGFRIGYRF
ncbi:hypothetical protein BTO06_15495 [Tenacibaculum sp. SZ-18]|uniref:hypothetical protein n=1 Tax=Tenacibaculum sp. SZ-18 TaxID=754423 RepID=UPI000C2D17C9|nr:hypothetical protein [Tenacibaculum sp. SZ-18]AUC16468.1 hypothetical protein BTO06_15495 [Tenacibaculum sp. SZ-18]